MRQNTVSSRLKYFFRDNPNFYAENPHLSFFQLVRNPETYANQQNWFFLLPTTFCAGYLHARRIEIYDVHIGWIFIILYYAVVLSTLVASYRRSIIIEIIKDSLRQEKQDRVT